MDRESTKTVIRVQFVLGTGLVSRTIAWYSSGAFSHVDAVLSNGDLLGARTNGGVQIRKANYDASDWVTRKVFTLVTDPLKEAAWYAFLHKQIGLPYDHTAIWGFVTGRDWREQDSWFCSELVAAALESAGALPVLYTPVNKVTPATLATVLSAVGAIAS